MPDRRLTWIGAKLPLPGYVMEPEPFRPDTILWAEHPSGVVIWAKVIDPDQPITLAESFEMAASHPLEGEPRRPERVRVADSEAAERLRAEFPAIEVVLAETPEIDAIVAEMAREMEAQEGETYLDEGRISVNAVAELFAAAEVLFRIAPWKRDLAEIRVDSPDLGIAGAVLSVIGSLGESVGLLLFPSLAGFEKFLRITERRRPPKRLGTSILSLEFVRGAELPASMRREVVRYAWPVASADAYPRVDYRGTDGFARPPTEQEVRTMTVVASALAAFVARHGDRLVPDDEEADIEPISESYTEDAGETVRLTHPFEAFDLFEPEVEVVERPTTPAARKLGRNDPCHCGSGKKYKKCCLAKDESPR